MLIPVFIPSLRFLLYRCSLLGYTAYIKPVQALPLYKCHIYSYMIRLKDILTEIRAEEAYRDEDAIQTVIDGRRELGFITIIGSPYKKEEFFDLIDSSGLNVMPVPENPYQAYIYYRNGAEEQARELRDIAMRYGGFLAYYATADETRRIGELLGYDREDIARFVAKNYPGYQYPDFTGIADTE